MSILLTAADLRPLVDDLGQLGGAFERVEDVVRGLHRQVPGSVGWVELPLTEGAVVGLFLTAQPEAAGIRLWDSLVEGKLEPAAHLMLLLDGTRGTLRALVSGEGLNPLRTSVPAGVGAKYLAPDGARVLSILGSGAQARSHARTFRHALPDLERIQVWSPTIANRERFAVETSAALDLPVHAASTPAEALADADVVTLTTPYGRPELDAAWIKPGALIVTMVGVATPAILQRVRLVLPSRTRPPAVALPERMQRAAQAAAGMPPAPLTLGEVVVGERPAREHAEQVLLYALNAPYPWDTAIMEWAVAWAEARGIGHHFQLS